ncbi:MAG: glycosyltransferase [Bryobacterales bacterium]|nr:glycosyltransferase [Bryobacteraceae bacterium]MDW8129482.1 glycosyltransferase [Bryobacterales bacterium]
MKLPVLVVFATGTEELNSELIRRFQALEKSLPLYVVSEFPPPEGRWIPYHPLQGFWLNWRRCRAALRGRHIRFAAVMLAPNLPYRRLRVIAFLIAPLRLLVYNENLDHWMLRPRCLPLIVRHFAWRLRNLVVFETHPGGRLYTFVWRMARPSQWRRPLLHCAARLAGWVVAALKMLLPAGRDSASGAPMPDGISVIIPSRNGRHLLASMLPPVLADLAGFASEVLVVDNGSNDATAGFLRERFPGVIVDVSPEPLGFAQAVNRGLALARYSHVCLLNNDMAIEPGFFRALRAAFDRVPDLFCATAQIMFPEGVRRQETGKAVLPPPLRRGRDDFPLRCETPLPGETWTYVLYGSGGCSMYDARKLRSLGGLDESYRPAYVEDLDVGYRAWLRGWPTVYVAEARVLHKHRATTSRYYSEEELNRLLETNYLRFLARSVGSARVFAALWAEAIERLNRRAAYGSGPALAALREAWRAALLVRRPAMASGWSDELALGAGSGEIAVFPGASPKGRAVVLVASPYLPFPLSHGGAVRMYNLMRRAAAEYDVVLVAFAEELAPPPPELAAICAEIVQVRRTGTHLRPASKLPDMVVEHAAPAFRAALRQTVRKWRPRLLQLEFTPMAQYADEAAGARTVLVEHDVTFDLHRQLAELTQDWEARRQYERWVRFETAAWKKVDCVVVMSERDRRMVRGARRVACLPNGVDLDRFRPAAVEPEPKRLLFIGSFAHLPNLLAMEFFLREIWPRLADLEPALHVIAGHNHRLYLGRYREHAVVELSRPGVEVEDFVADPRPAYARASVVIAPLVASAGTNIKILEAMAMGKAIVSTRAGIHGLDLQAGSDLLVADTPEEFAAAVRRLLLDPGLRRTLGHAARATAERDYGWDRIARLQAELYRALADE